MQAFKASSYLEISSRYYFPLQALSNSLKTKENKRKSRGELVDVPTYNSFIATVQATLTPIKSHSLVYEEKKILLILHKLLPS